MRQKKRDNKNQLGKHLLPSSATLSPQVLTGNLLSLNATQTEVLHVLSTEFKNSSVSSETFHYFPVRHEVALKLESGLDFPNVPPGITHDDIKQVQWKKMYCNINWVDRRTGGVKTASEWVRRQSEEAAVQTSSPLPAAGLIWRLLVVEGFRKFWRKVGQVDLQRPITFFI